jgi:hypothetical protein
MNSFYITLAASPALLLGAVAFLVFIVAGIRRGDRSDLGSPARDRIDAITRRVVGVGVRNDPSGEDGEI